MAHTIQNVELSYIAQWTENCFFDSETPLWREVRSHRIWISVRIGISVSVRKKSLKIVKYFCNLKNIAS